MTKGAVKITIITVCNLFWQMCLLCLVVSGKTLAVYLSPTLYCNFLLLLCS